MTQVLIPTWTRGERLRKAREAAGYKQKDWAELLGIGLRSVTNYEKDLAPPKRPVMLAWAMASPPEFTLEWLEVGDDNPQPDGSSSADRRTADANTQGEPMSLWIYENVELVAA